ncbi:hypothetical protein [Martelella sp. HB161492]|uniref:hypothetical protein n=1 Tax=Martelella sp. HB161492 TaxID=2720726 RepID=UPI0015900FA1|nr:hypothetical protein [Martelella sp. HB161492]
MKANNDRAGTSGTSSSSGPDAPPKPPRSRFSAEETKKRNEEFHKMMREKPEQWKSYWEARKSHDMDRQERAVAALKQAYPEPSAILQADQQKEAARKAAEEAKREAEREAAKLAALKLGDKTSK